MAVARRSRRPHRFGSDAAFDGPPDGSVNATVYANGERRATVDFGRSPRRVSADADSGDTVRVAPFDTTWTVPGSETGTTTPDSGGGGTSGRPQDP